MRKRLSVAALKKILRYDESTGDFYWLVTRGWRAIAGTKAGSLHSHGYVHYHISGLIYKGHRLAWAFKKGKHPRHDVEHRDLNKANNRWVNLRKANDFQNQANTAKRPDNTSGFKGVSYRKDKGVWRVRIQSRHRRLHLADVATAEEGAAIYALAALRIFGEFARLK